MGEGDREEAAFGDPEGFKPLSGKLRPEVRELAEALRRLLKGSGKSQRQFAVYHHIGVSTVSRYLSGERIPDKHFLDGLMKSACTAHGTEVSADLQGRMYRLHRDALLAEAPARYREQMASDRLEDAVLREEETQLEMRELRTTVEAQKSQLRALESQLRQVEAAERQEHTTLRADLERYRMRKEELAQACARLRDKVARLEKALREAERARDAARRRCQELEAELVTAQEGAEREELQQQAREVRLRLAEAAEVAEQRLATLERVHQEAERVRLAAAREAATQLEAAQAEAANQLEEAQSKAEELLQEAALKAQRVRPAVLRRSTALRQVRDAAQELAQQRLPQLIRQLSTGDPEHVDTVVRSVGINSQDDVGETARALDTAHRALVAFAVDQARQRRNATAMLVNLARRTQVLLQGQLSLLSELESREAEPDRLSPLLRLDHLATRMRRNVENCFVLADKEPGRCVFRAIPFSDVLRAAACEVEQYERIEPATVPAVKVVGRLAPDLVHLLAELLENATSFSAPHSQVRVVGQMTCDGRMLIEVDDDGIGLAPEERTAINERLAAPPLPAEVSDSRRMGLFVVGRLAERHGVRVQLAPSDTGGTTALVILPAHAIECCDAPPECDPLAAGGQQGTTAPAHLFTICDSGRLTLERPR